MSWDLPVPAGDPGGPAFLDMVVGPSLELGALENFHALTSNSPSPATGDAARGGGPGTGQQKPAVKGGNAQKMWLVGGVRPEGGGGGFP